jgi:N6-adenosine-specific RNA methylase IME4
MGKMGKGRDMRPGRVVPVGGDQIKTPYPTMPLAEIEAMPVSDLADEAAHLWLWTTNKTLEDGFKVMRAWGFKYLAPIHWIKPAGIGAWFVHVSQTCLFGYKGKCVFPLERYKRNVIQTGPPKRHSEKPEAAFALIEAVSPGPRIELFARRARPGWTVWGNEVEANSAICVTEARNDR